MLDFNTAAANWAACYRPEPDTGWKDTCGSAERMYASSPERGRQPGAEVRVYGTGDAQVFERLVRDLPDHLRLAWHIKTGFRPMKGKSEEWINENYNLARATLSVWWCRLHR